MDNVYHYPKQGKLDDFEENLYNFLPFLRIHRTYLINIHNIHSINWATLEIAMKLTYKTEENEPPKFHTVKIAKTREKGVSQVLKYQLDAFQGVWSSTILKITL